MGTKGRAVVKGWLSNTDEALVSQVCLISLLLP
jgi:hypothetical protein